MPQYRCYFIDRQNHVTSFKILELADEKLAQAEAEKLWRNGVSHGFELWDGPRIIHRQVKSA